MATKDRCPTCSSQNKSDIRHISIKGSPWTPCTDPWHEGRSSSPAPLAHPCEHGVKPGDCDICSIRVEPSIWKWPPPLDVRGPEWADIAFRQWERDTGRSASASERNAFLDGYKARSEGAPLPAPSPEVLEDYGAGPNWPMLSKELDRLPEHERNNFIADVISQIDDTQFFRIFKRNATIYAKSYPVSGRVSPTPGKVENTAPEVITANQERGISPESSSPVEPEILRQWRDPRNHFEELWHKEILAYIDGLKGKPAASHEDLVIEIARELYDRFVMGGWQPQDAYPQIRGWLAQVGDSGAHKEK